MIIEKRHALLWGPMFIFIVAFVLHINQMYTMFAAVGMLAPVSYLLGRRKLAGIGVSRQGKSVMTAGERGTVTLTVRNEGRVRQFFLAVRDRLPEGLESPENGEALVSDLAPGEQQRVAYSLFARRRGAYQVGPTALEGSDYLGLYKFTRRAGPAPELLVYPRAMPIPNLWPQSLRGRSPHRPRRRYRGPSSEFYGVREYYPGDDPRRVDWKTSARRGKLAVIGGERWRLAGDYLFFAEPPVGKPIEIAFDLPQRELVLKHRLHDIRIRLRGDQVTAMDNFGADLTYFPAYE